VATARTASTGANRKKVLRCIGHLRDRNHPGVRVHADSRFSESALSESPRVLDVLAEENGQLVEVL
jgi:hypothetical protein